MATESVIRRMTRLAVEHDAVNLSQGFTDGRPPFELVWTAVSALLGGTNEEMARLDGASLAELVPGVDPADLGHRPLRPAPTATRICGSRFVAVCRRSTRRPAGWNAWAQADA